MIIKYFLAFISYGITSLTVCEATVSAVSQFRMNNKTGLVKLAQEEDGLRVTGEISGLKDGQYALLLVSLTADGCQAVGEAAVKAEVHNWDQGTGETVAINKLLNQTGLNPEPESQELTGLLIRSCEISLTGVNCQKGEILQCAEPTPPSSPVQWQILVVIAIAVFLLVLVLICIPLICYCVKRSRRKQSEDDLEDEYEGRSKSPMYDELSLPFIDASLPPTPKVGRIVNGLDILLGHGVSENSLVDKKSQVQW